MKKSSEIRGYDSMSEKSDGTTATSVSGRESAYNGAGDDLQELVTLLGLTKVEDVYQERFRVDRRKLERMLRGRLYILHVIFHDATKLKHVRKEKLFDV